MARTLHKLSAVKVASLKTPGLHGDGGGLHYRVAPGGATGWIFRFSLNGKTRDAGLGPYPTVSLRHARELAAEYRQLVAEGTDPIVDRDRKRQAARIADAKTATFNDVAAMYLRAHGDSWSRKHREQWTSSLAAHASPVVGRLAVGTVDTDLILRILQPLWSAGKVETGSRVRARLEQVLSFAAIHGFRPRNEINPAAWKNHLAFVLPRKGKVHQVQHFKALDYRAVPALVDALRQQQSVAPHALIFVILTATRVGEALNMVWSEVDFDTRTATIPSRKMKARKEFRIPLSDAAIEVLRAMAAIRHNDFVFPGARDGRPVSQNSLLILLRKIKCDGVVHGMRSAFSTWASECTHTERHIIELCLAHTVGNEVERAYKRTDLLARRAELMASWGTFCTTPSVAEGKVVPIRRK
jgi:integrase